MGRTAVTTDVFSAISEPRRREILERLARVRSQSVGELVEALGMAQPAVSKHLGVLRAVGVVSVRPAGKNRLYSLNPETLKPVQAWCRQFERLWSEQLTRIKTRAERLSAERTRRN